MQILKRYVPLAFIDNNTLLLYRYGYICKYNCLTNTIKDKTKILSNFKEKYCSRIKLLYRLLRLGIRSCILLEDRLLLLIGNYLYEYNLKINKLYSGRFCMHNVKTLYISEIKDINGFDNSIVFGEYFNNPDKKEVSIYKRISTNNWQIIYTFKKGLINHIHNIVSDKFNNCVWILTGDFNNGAGIWRATDNFNIVEPILYGKQCYRACIAFPSVEGLVYVTDSPFEQNYIRILKSVGNNKYVSSTILEIKGSVIYGCTCNNDIVFSTVVEPNGIYKNKFSMLFDRTKGDAISDYNSYIYKGNIKNGFEIIHQSKKDIYPFVLFGFGVLKFPFCTEINGNLLPIFNYGTSKNDLSTILISIKKETKQF
jgi:hypothetical protein